MHRSPEVLRIPPVEPTPVHGCFKDHTENHQDFPALETLRTRQNSTTKLPLLPHYLVLSNKGMSKYKPLNISEFVCGYIEIVKLYPQTQDDLYGHLQVLMGKAMTYSWNSVKIFHLDCTFLFEQGRMSWRQRNVITGKGQYFLFTSADLRETTRLHMA